MKSCIFNIKTIKLGHKTFLILIFILFCITRFYNIEQRIIFGWDQEQFSTQIWDIVVNHKFTLLGPRVNNDLGFFLAPYLTYLLLPLYLLTNLYPSAMIGFIIAANLLFFVAGYKILKNIFSQQHALWFLALWTINPLMQGYDSVPWWPLLIPIGVITSIGLLHHIAKNHKSPLSWILLGLTGGFFMNMHFQFIFIIFLAIVVIFLIKRRKQTPAKNIVFALVSFMIMFLPLFVFDLRHDFLNTKLFFQFFFANSNNSGESLFSWIPVFTNFFKPYTILSNPFIMIILYIAFLNILTVLKKSKKGFVQMLYKSIFIISIFTLLLISLYRKRPSEYYFVFLSPLFILAWIDYLLTTGKRTLLVLITALLMLVGSGDLYNNLKDNKGGLYYKNKVVEYIKDVAKDKEFAISYEGVSVDHGFAYLLKYHNLTPTEDPKAPLIRVSIPAGDSDNIIGLYGVRIPTFP